VVKWFFCVCRDCGEEWAAQFSCESGLLEALNSQGEECDCGSSDIDVQEEWDPAECGPDRSGE